MSGLAAVLAGRVPPGAYRWHAAFDVEQVRHTVERAGARFGYLDGVLAPTVPDFHAAISRSLGFPDHYGRNLDALADCLREVPDTTVLLWDAWAALARAEPRVFGVAVELLGASLTVLLRGDGPDVGLPDLD